MAGEGTGTIQGDVNSRGELVLKRIGWGSTVFAEKFWALATQSGRTAEPAGW